MYYEKPNNTCMYYNETQHTVAAKILKSVDIKVAEKRVGANRRVSAK